jgi:Domain of unknown function (DUF4340)
MKSKTTIVWFALAAALFAAIWLLEKYFAPGAMAVDSVLHGLRAAELTRLQISPAGQREISAVHSHGVWLLEKPLAYPAQSAAVQTLAEALEKLAPATRLTAADMRAHKNAEQEFGFENPRFTLVINAGDQQWQLLVGNQTAPGDQVFLRVIGLDGAFVTAAGWLQFLPHMANDWRDTSLVEATGAGDWIVVTNGTKTLEFRRDATNQVWRMIRPLAARADATRIAAALQQLRDGRVAQFITDDPRADLSNYGLQPADLSVWLGQGTNLTAGVSVGKNPAENPALVFTRREGWNAVVTADKNHFSGWRGAVNDYRDSHLFALTTPVAEIEVRGEENYLLTQSDSNAWAVAGEKFPADTDNVGTFLKLLAGLRVAEFVKDVATPADLQSFGLATPNHQIILRAKAGATNSTLVQVLFGTNDTGRVLVKRTDEDFVYALKAEDVGRLPEHGWEFRDRAIWNFSETNIAQVTLRQNGRTRGLVRTGENKWSLGPNSQGIINPPAIEETMHRLGSLTVAGWVGRNLTAPEKYGLNPGNLSITVELKSGEKLDLSFGAELSQSQTALAATTLAGERWAFVFPPVLYQFVATYLTIPPNSP